MDGIPEGSIAGGTDEVHVDVIVANMLSLIDEHDREGPWV